jgi:hypothetical protein
MLGTISKVGAVLAAIGALIFLFDWVASSEDLVRLEQKVAMTLDQFQEKLKKESAEEERKRDTGRMYDLMIQENRFIELQQQQPENENIQRTIDEIQEKREKLKEKLVE